MTEQSVSDSVLAEVYRTIDRLDGEGNAVNGEPTVQQVLSETDSTSSARHVRSAFNRLVEAGRIETHRNVNPVKHTAVRTATTDVSSESAGGRRSRAWTTDGVRVDSRERRDRSGV